MLPLLFALLVLPSPVMPTLHDAYDAVLKAYVTDDGWVDYARLKADQALDPYLEALAQANPDTLSEAGQVAFWINAYNAFTLKLVVDHYPVSSIRRITPTGIPISIPFIHSPFQIRFAEVAGDTVSLDHIEHDILRKHYDEPRIHFALVCAARSCPKLRREAYRGDRLDAQLDDQARSFLEDPTKNRVDDDDGTIHLSSIFNWFRGDFASSRAGLQAYLAQYFDGQVREKLENGAYRIRYLDYDWTLNDID